MTKRRHTKLIHEGDYAAEIIVELMDDAAGWPPYLSLEDAQKIDEVRRALRQGNLQTAGQLARVFRLTPIGA